MTFVASRAVHAQVEVARLSAGIGPTRREAEQLTAAIADHLVAVADIDLARPIRSPLRLVRRVMHEVVSFEASSSIPDYRWVLLLSGLLKLRLLLLLFFGSFHKLYVQQVVDSLLLIPVY